MIPIASVIAAVGVTLVGTSGAFAQSAAAFRGAAPLVPLASEPPPKLIVDPPLAESLSHNTGRRTCTSYRYTDPTRSRSHRASAISISRWTTCLGTG
jgi:hypothetical protein